MAKTRSLPGAVLTEGTGFEFGDLGFFQDDSDLCMSDEGEAFGFTREAEGPGSLMSVIAAALREAGDVVAPELPRRLFFLRVGVAVVDASDAL